ncbi:MAG: hypothetical protein ACFFB2_20565 [Promethearchaeota archaeon]
MAPHPLKKFFGYFLMLLAIGIFLGDLLIFSLLPDDSFWASIQIMVGLFFLLIFAYLLFFVGIVVQIFLNRRFKTPSTVNREVVDSDKGGMRNGNQ